MNSKKDFRLIRRSKRHLSDFMAKELLYDHLCQRLDPERVEALEEMLASSAELRAKFESLKKAQSYCALLSNAEMSQPLIGKAKYSSNKMSLFVSKLNIARWPQLLRWSFEALILSAVLFSAIVLIWPTLFDRFSRQELGEMLFELRFSQEKAIQSQETAEQALSPNAYTQSDQALNDLSGTEYSEKILDSQDQQSNLGSQEVVDVTVEEAEAVGKEEAQVKMPTSATVDADNPTSSKVESPSEKTEVVSEVKDASSGALRGTLYRIFMELKDLDQIAPQISAEIVALDGQKAGEVPLGWRKPKGSYYHFTVPENRYDELVVALKKYGAVRIYQDPHPRIMPEGVLRLILWIEDVSL